MLNIRNILFDIGTSAFLEPYLRRQLRAERTDGATPAQDSPDEPYAAVKIVTDCDEGRIDHDFEDATARLMLPVLVLRCPAIVATGMNGLPRRIAESIYSGRYVQIAGNEARISVVHAVDVARAAADSAGVQGTFTLTDCTDPTINDLADALAHRIKGKRLFTIKPRWVRLWYGRSYFTALTSDHTAPCTYCEAFPDFRPVAVTEYLRTHNYDEDSL